MDHLHSRMVFHISAHVFKNLKPLESGLNALIVQCFFKLFQVCNHFNIVIIIINGLRIVKRNYPLKTKMGIFLFF